MLDRIDTCSDRVLDGLCSVRMCGDFAAEFVRLFSDGLHLLERVLRSARLVAFAQNASRGADLDQVGAVLDDFADFRAGGPGTVGHAFGFVMVFIGKKVVVAMSTGNSQWG